MLNEVFGNVELSEAEMQTLIWLVKRAENTVANVVSAIRKAMTSDASGGNCSPVRRAGKAPGRAQRQLLNKAYAPYPALITTRQGRKESY